MTATNILKVQEAYQCLKYIRIAPGKVYEYELYQLLDRPELIHEDINIAKMINDLFKLDFAVCDIVESSYASEGLNVIYTNPEYRLVLDILLSTQDYHLDRTVYIDCTEEIITDNVATIKLYYHEVEKQLDALIKKHPNHYYILQALQIFKNWPHELKMDVVTTEQIMDHFNGKVLNLSGKYVKDFDYAKLSKTTDEPVILENFIAEQAFFSGNKIAFDNARFRGGVSFKGSIFKAVTLSFQNACFELESELYDTESALNSNEVTFRNSRMFIRDFLFDGVIMGGGIENKILSFEDAVIEAKYLSFSKVKFDSITLFCYQSLMDNASIRFIEPEFENSKIDFEDSVINEIIMLNIAEIPQTAFNFRRCKRLIIENCNFVDNIILGGMEILSLRACRNQGKILTDWAKKTKDAKGNKNYPILLAIMNNADNNQIKAEQFILLKENFANIGQYDYEDEAFIQYMNHKCKNSPIRGIYELLRCIGQYGISPTRVLLTMVVTVIFFCLLNFGCALLIPNAFSYNAFDIGLLENLGNSFYLSVSNLVSYNSSIYPDHYVTIIISIIESVIGWFLLGYLSIAVVRKTLR